MPEIRSFGSFGLLGVQPFSQWDVVFSEDNKPNQTWKLSFIFLNCRQIQISPILSNFSSISVVILIIILIINVFFMLEMVKLFSFYKVDVSE